MADVFISYSRKDKAFVERLDEALRQREREAWVDWEGIRPTEEFMQAIYSAIESADTFIFVLSPESISSMVCGKEIAHAIAQNKRMVPLVARDVNAPEVPDALAKLNWIFCRDSDDFQQATEILISALDTDLEWVRAHTRLLTRAVEWETKGKNNSFVLRGDDLREAERWLTEAGSDKERQPTPLQTEYIIASRKAAARRQRIIWGSVSLGLVIATAFAVAAYFQRQSAEQQRNIAGARQLSTEAGITRDRRSDALQTSVLLAAQSLRRFPSLEADQVLRRGLWLLAAPVTRFTQEDLIENSKGDNQPPVAAFSPDARLVALVLANHSVELREVRTGRVIATLPHNESVGALRFSPDSKLLATAGFVTAHVWETEHGREIVSPIQHRAPIDAVAVTADNRLLVASSDGQTVQIVSLMSSSAMQSQVLNVNTGDPSNSGGVDAIAVSPDGKYVATSWRMDPVVWETATGHLVAPASRKNSHNRHPNALAFSPDGETFASAGLSDEAVHIFETASGRELFVLPQYGDVTLVAYSPRGTYLATASSDMAARVWEATEGHRLKATVVHEARITALTFAPDEQSFVTASEDNTARICDIGSAQETLRIIHQKPVRALAFSADGASIATAGDDGMVAVWQSKTGPELAFHFEPDSPPSNFHFSADGRVVATMIENKGVLWDPITGAAIAFSANNEASRFVLTDDLRLAASTNGETAVVWDVASRKLIATLKHPSIDWAAVRDRPEVKIHRSMLAEIDKLAERGSVEVVAFSPNERLLLTRRLRPLTTPSTGYSPFEDEGRIWDVNTGTEKWPFQGFTTPLLARTPLLASFSPDSRLLAVAADDAVRIFDAQTGQELAVINKAVGDGGEERALHLAFSTDNRLAVAGPRSLLIWNEEGSRIADRKFDALLTQFVCSPSSPLIATAHYGGAVQIWNAEDGSNVDTVTAHGEIRCLAFSPDGTLLATGGDDFSARVRDPRKHYELAAFKHLDVVLSVTFSADGKLLATGSQDETARVWDIRTNEAVAVINHPARLSRERPRICAVALTPDARYLVTGEQNGRACVWPLQPAELIKQAAARITRPLSGEERTALDGAR
ncbi:MAG TPA: TIR domain-containing protein [Terrimicrobiaceae bacterium]